MASEYDVPAIRRTHDILRVLASRRGPVKASELAEACKLARSTLYLLLDCLEQRRWIERRDGGYVMGIELMALGSAYLRQDGLQTAFQAAAGAFVARHNEVVQLATLDGFDVVYLAREDARRPVRLVSDLGLRLPASACALGKALLASLSLEDLAARVPDTLPRVTERSLATRAALDQELAQVRNTGLAQDLEEVATGLVCFAAYVGVTPLGKRIAVSTSIPTDRLDEAHRRDAMEGIRLVARDIALRVIPGA
ncbi:IclR family transcriptional regulator [Achromobacter insolitus]|uniref:IclR family transcriptional regulator n=1 Tax=Achromobacter insolitus TaxID=217204 RepID=UPI00053846D2|nr:IclR family transcriptional regulator [Achromobacter insolitus]AVG43759.1 IclR family transcriptional regulator [Achromobacter insolitus]MCP1399941.1 DNA-binding IclR family transcriptional regulator [Achromobacter insolitus]MDH3067029.1 IclR family transcriptional regulator [Achromobacter insolitus]OAE64182.1 IclR family transcriptional regulator [Achromobacter insolitus]OCZ58044.1 IclR family transcriptional regulator [Achromobacter insolitus]